MEQHFPKLPKKRKTSRGIAKFSKMFSRKFSFHSTLFPEFPEFSVEWFSFRKFNSFQDFWNLFREISVPLPLFPNFRNYWLNMESAPCEMVICFVCLTLVPPLLSSVTVCTTWMTSRKGLVQSHPSQVFWKNKVALIQTRNLNLLKVSVFYPES